MNTHPRPAEWIAVLRDEAKTHGRPLLAMSMPAVLPIRTGGLVTYAQKRGSRMVATSLLSSGKTARLDADMLMKIIKGAGYTNSQSGVVVIPDLATAGALQASVEADKTTAGRIAARALSMCRSLTASRHVVVLTEALERKFYAPAGMDTTDITAWRSAFGLAGLSALEADKRLYRMVLTGHSGLADDSATLTTEESPTHTLRKAVSAEEAILDSLEFTGIASECSRFANAGVVSAVWSFVTATDPERRELSSLDGSVFSAKIIKASSEKVYARIIPPFKAKVGKDLIALPREVAGDDKRDPQLVLDDITADLSGEFVAHLSVPRSNFPYAVGDTIDLVQSPFIPTAMRTARTRWTSTQVDTKRTYREVPLSVSLAGAPEEGAAAA